MRCKLNLNWESFKSSTYSFIRWGLLFPCFLNSEIFFSVQKREEWRGNQERGVTMDEFERLITFSLIFLLANHCSFPYSFCRIVFLTWNCSWGFNLTLTETITCRSLVFGSVHFGLDPFKQNEHSRRLCSNSFPIWETGLHIRIARAYQ